MTDWYEQPPAVRATLNPLLIAGVLAWASAGYRTASDEPMPWPLGFIVPALVLHTPTRKALPAAASKRLLAWRDENDALVAGLPARCLAIEPYVRAGLRAGLTYSLLALDGVGLRSQLPSARTPEELKDLRKSAALVGRWFGPVPVATVMAQLGMTT